MSISNILSQPFTVGTGLQRPECVLATKSGHVFVSDKRGGVLQIRPDGSQHLTCESNLLPNGIALLQDGSFLVANLGPDGGVWKIDAEGNLAPWLTEADGQPLGRVNFVTVDAQNRIWICISAADGGDNYPVDTATGRIVMDDGTGARVVATGLHYTNECRVSADGGSLYVNETFGRRLSRFKILPSGQLGPREVIAVLGQGDFPDGLALDAEGGAWIACVGSNRLYRVAADGEATAVIDDSIEETVQQLEAAFNSNTLTRPMLSAARGHTLFNISSVAFGGPDLKTVYLGSLGGTSLVAYKSTIAGLPLAHWEWR